MATVKFDVALSSDGETPYLFNVQTADYKKGIYCIQISMFKGKIYIHFQNNKKGTQVSFPEDVWHGIAGSRDELQAAIDTFRNNSSPPSPPMITISPPKKRKRKIEEDDEDEILFA